MASSVFHLQLRHHATSLQGSLRKRIPHVLIHGCANHATEGETLQSPIHCCDVTKPPYLFSGDLCTSSLHCKSLFMFTVCCRRAVSVSLCSEHVNRKSYCRNGRHLWEKLRHRAVTQCATLAHPCPSAFYHSNGNI